MMERHKYTSAQAYTDVINGSQPPAPPLRDRVGGAPVQNGHSLHTFDVAALRRGPSSATHGFSAPPLHILLAERRNPQRTANSTLLAPVTAMQSCLFQGGFREQERATELADKGSHVCRLSDAGARRG